MRNIRRSLLLLVCASVLSTRAQADERAETLRDRVIAFARTAQSFTADMTLSNGKKIEATATLKVKKPLFLRVELDEADGRLHETRVVDGKTEWNLYVPPAKATRIASLIHSPLDKDYRVYFPGEGWPAWNEPAFEDTLAMSRLPARYVGTQTVEDVSCEVIELTGHKQTVRWYIGPDSQLRRVEETQQRYLSPMSTAPWDVRAFSHFHWNADLPDSDFVFHPPAQTVPGINNKARAVPMGWKVPAFLLPQVNGKPLSLAAALKGKKALFIFFNFG